MDYCCDLTPLYIYVGLRAVLKPVSTARSFTYTVIAFSVEDIKISLGALVEGSKQRRTPENNST